MKVLMGTISFRKYKYTPMKDTIVRLKQVLLSNITMMKIDKIKTLPKRCKKSEAMKVGSIRTNNENIDELLQEIHRRDKLNIDFDIEYDGEDINGG